MNAFACSGRKKRWGTQTVTIPAPPEEPAPDVPDDFLRSNLSNRLPPYNQTILAGQAVGNLDAASQLADRIAEFVPPPSTAYIAQEQDKASLLQKIEDLTRQVAALSSGHIRHRSRSRDKRTGNCVPSPAHRPRVRGYCRYHTRFGDKARKCTPPCSFQQQGNGSDRR